MGESYDISIAVQFIDQMKCAFDVDLLLYLASCSIVLISAMHLLCQDVKK